MRATRKIGQSTRLFRSEPWMSLALGGALVVGLGSVCCGLGAVAVPWFGCELFASQIGAATGHRPARTRSWIAAGVFLFVAVLIISSAAWLATLGLGPDARLFDSSSRLGGDDLRAIGLSAGGALLALVFIVPFLYAPIILVDRGGSLGGAVLESARLVITDGPLAHLRLSVSSHLVQASPVILAAAVAELYSGTGEIPWAVLATLPLLAITIPLGQGMIVAAWLERRDRLVDPSATRPTGRPNGALVVVLTSVLVSPVLALALVVASLARPSQPTPGAAPEGEVLVDSAVAPGGRALPIPGTALEVRLEDGWVSVEASDGGGTGRVPRPSPAAVEHVRVVRVRDAYAIEARTASGSWVTWVSRAGVRLDDDLRARLTDRLPAQALVVLGLAMLLTPILIGRVLVRLAEVRRLAAEQAPDAAERAVAARPGAQRAGWLAAAALGPLSLAALVVAVLALVS